MNVTEAAEFLGVAVRTIYRWRMQVKGNNGYLIFNGKAVLFRCRQTGPSGNGKLIFEPQGLDDFKRAIEGTFPQQQKVSRPTLRNIHVELGVPRQ